MNQNQSGYKKKCKENRERKLERQDKRGAAHLCSPDAAQGLSHTDVICLEFVQADSGREGESAQEPVAGGAELGDTLGGGEVVNDGGPGEVVC